MLHHHGTLHHQNELGILEFIHALVETLDKYFENVCELDIMFNLEKAHFILGSCGLGLVDLVVVCLPLALALCLSLARVLSLP